MAKKLLIFLGVIAFVTAGCILRLMDGTDTIAELCDVERGTKITAVQIIASSDGPYYGPRTIYTSGEVYDTYVAMFFETKFHVQYYTHSDDNTLIWAGAFYESIKIQYELETHETITFLISPHPDSDSKYLALMSAKEPPREEYVLVYEDWLNPAELEKLARGMSE